MTNLLLSLLANATVVSSGAIGSKSTTPANSNSDLSLDAYSRPYGVLLEFRGCYLRAVICGERSVTFSIVAREPDASLFGVAIASSSPAVAARCSHARAGVGAVATQDIANPALGSAVLDQLQRGRQADAAVKVALATEPYASYRQLLAIGPSGPAVIHCGSHVLDLHGQAIGRHAAAAGNLLASAAVPAAMIESFEQAPGHFGNRLLTALQAGLTAGGEAGSIHSAGLLIVRDISWPIVDLRADWTESDPIAALVAAWNVYAPQIEDYVQRAWRPMAALSFNVPTVMPP